MHGKGRRIQCVSKDGADARNCVKYCEIFLRFNDKEENKERRRNKAFFLLLYFFNN